MVLDGSLQEVVSILSKALYGEPMVCLITAFLYFRIKVYVLLLLSTICYHQLVLGVG